MGIGPVLHRKYGAKCQLHMENPIFVYSNCGVHLLPYLTVVFGKPLSPHSSYFVLFVI